MRQLLTATVFTFSTCCATFCGAQTIAIDDFSDGDIAGWTTIDGTTGMPWAPGIFDATSGEFVLATTGAVPPKDPPFTLFDQGVLVANWDASSDPTFSQGFFRGKIRSESQANSNLFIRADLSMLVGYVFDATPPSGEFRLFNLTSGGSEILGVIEGMQFMTGEDWWMEAGAVGNRLSMKVWKDGDVEPAVPQLVVFDDTHAFGTLGVTSAVQVNETIAPDVMRTVYDDLSFTPVPEPSALALVAVLAIAAALHRFRVTGAG